MRLIPLLTACLVALVLYLVVFERPMLLGFAQNTGLYQLPEVENSTEMTTEADAQSSRPEIVAEAEVVAEADSEAGAETPPAKGAVGVIAMRSVAQMVDRGVILRGETAAARQVDLRAETSGTVISEPLRKGAFVETGQQVCKLDPGSRASSLEEARARLAEARARMPETEARIPEAQARLEEARAQLEEAQINDNAAERLSQGGFASDTRVAAARAASRSAEASVSAAEAQLKAASSGVEATKAGIQSAEAAVASVQNDIDRLTITAPFAGLLETDSAELGSLLQPGGTCATIIQLDPIKLVGFVPETEVARVEVGAPAGARLTGGREVAGRVTFLSRSADATTRTFRVEVDVANADLSIRDGQTAEILIQAEGAMAHLLPSSALTLNDEGKLGVRLVTDEDTAQFNAITLIRDTREGIWVSGLPDDAAVITVGQEYVTDGVAVAASFEDVIQ